MNLALYRSTVSLRPWTSGDLLFSLRVRNHPELMKYFRQNEPITEAVQAKFIAYDTGDFGVYNGMVIEDRGVPVGLCGVKNSAEFTIAVLPEHQGKGIALAAMQLMIKNSEYPIWSEVFVGNPALEFFISKCGFKVIGVRERAYYKPDQGLVDVVVIKYDPLCHH